MAADIIMVHPPERRGVLVPATVHDMEMLTKHVTPGKDVRAKLTQSRSLPQHRFYWALLQKTVDSHPFYASADALHIWLKLKLGHVEYIELHDGRVHIRAGSTSFEKMDGITFREYLDKSIDLIVTEVLPHVKRGDLLLEVQAMLGITYQQATGQAA